MKWGNSRSLWERNCLPVFSNKKTACFSIY